VILMGLYHAASTLLLLYLVILVHLYLLLHAWQERVVAKGGNVLYGDSLTGSPQAYQEVLTFDS
jgi:hypothetical protein